MKLIKHFTACLLLTLFIVPALAQDKEQRAARSVHLWYQAPESTIFYNEAQVLESTAGSYFMVCGFRHGYFGIQELFNGKKVVLFSVWDPGNQNDPNIVPEDRRVKVLHEGKDVRVSRFGNEGTGGKSMYTYDWNIGETYRCMVKCDVEGKRTTYSAFFYLNEEKRWKHLASFQTLTGGDYLKGYYSFVEDFRRDGKSAKERRKARYGHGWVRDRDGHWISLTQTKFTADNTQSDKINAGVEEGWFFLANGGDTENMNPLGSTFTILPINDLPRFVLE